MIPDSVASIGDYAFRSCSGLTSVTIPGGVTNIGNYAFSGCSGLTSITIPDGVTSIGTSAFSGCSGLAAIVVGEGNSAYKSGNGLLLSKDGSTLIAGVNGVVTIPGSVMSIASYAFDGCTNLTGVTIPDSVTSIWDFAFRGCSGLASVAFMGNAPFVGIYTFYDHGVGAVASVSSKSTGWDVEVGGIWNGLTLQYWPEVLTVAENDAEVCEIMSTCADAKLASEIATVKDYEALKAWVNGKNLYQPAVVANAHAAAAYLLGAERLFENEPTVEIGEVSVGDGESAGTTAMTVAVTVKDGESAVSVSAAKVAAMFEATGDLGDWTGAAKLTPMVTTTGTDANGKMTFVVTPGDGTAKSAFLRIRQ